MKSTSRPLRYHVAADHAVAFVEPDAAHALRLAAQRAEFFFVYAQGLPHRGREQQVVAAARHAHARYIVVVRDAQHAAARPREPFELRHGQAFRPSRAS